jgi:hypothetical protein
MISKSLLISNLAPGTTDEELVSLVKKYAPDLECLKVVRTDGDGSRPAALLSFVHMKLDSLDNLSQRLDGMFWKGRTLSATTTMLG